MKYTRIVPSVVVALGLTGGIASAATQALDAQQAGASLFQMTEVSSQGLLTAKKEADDKCGKGACGSAKHDEKKDADHKCGADKCGKDKHGEHKCGSDKKDADHKCANHKCGAEKGEHEKGGHDEHHDENHDKH